MLFTTVVYVLSKLKKGETLSMNLQKYFERLREKVRKNNKRNMREIAKATRLDPIRRAFPSEQ